MSGEIVIAIVDIAKNVVESAGATCSRLCSQ